MPSGRSSLFPTKSLSTADAYLSKAQHIEENIRSVDYDVWQCAGCQDTKVWNYPNRSSRYKKCSYGDSQTSFFISRKTLRAASYSSSGQDEEIYGCVQCGKRSARPITSPNWSTPSAAVGAAPAAVAAPRLAGVVGEVAARAAAVPAAAGKGHPVKNSNFIRILTPSTN